MKFEEYGTQAITTLLGNHGTVDITPQLMAQVLGLVGESGEVAEKFKKLIRDNEGRVTSDDKVEILKELGDILWYINTIAISFGSNLEEVAQKNLDKVLSRKARGVTTGSGDNR